MQSILAAAIWLSATFAASLSAAEDEGVESGRKALSSAAKTAPWYDASKDETRPLRVPPFRPSDDPNRRSSWEYQPSPSKTAAPPPPASAVSVGGSPFVWGLSVYDLVGLLLLSTAIIGLCIYLAWAFFKDDTEESSAALRGAEPKKGAVDRVSELPLELGKVRGDFLSAARAEYEAGNYSQAVIYLFSYELLQLDRHQLIRLARGKTNRQYLREVRPRPELRSVLEQTMIAFEDVFFGKHSLSRNRFESCWDKVDEFHRQLESLPS
jgi:hypothetical protein